MATNKVTYHCGCGFHTEKVEEAEKHSDSKYHTMFATGEIRPEPRPTTWA